MFGLAAAIIASNKGRHILAWLSGLWAGAAIAIGITCRLPLVLVPSLLLVVLSLSLPDKTQDRKPSMYYCRSCGFTGYQKAKKFELRCPKCKAPLMKTDTSRESWDALSKEEKEALQAEWSGKNLLSSEPKESSSPKPLFPSEITYPNQPRKVPPSTLEAAPKPDFVSSLPAAIPSATVAYCRRCGKRIPDGSRFCQYCGLRI